MKHGTTAYRRGCRCDECREAVSAYQARIASEGRGWAARPRKNRTCNWCGVPVRSNAGRARDGLTLCSKHRTQKYRLDERAAARRAKARSKIDKATAGVPANRRWSFVQGVCGFCEEPFTRRGAASSFCSKACNKKNRRRQDRQLRGKRWISDADRFSVYERDGWVCQLCFEPVDRTAYYLDDWAPSLDHIEPRALSLIPNDSPSALRTAHRWCNSVRGDGTYNKDFFEEAS